MEMKEGLRQKILSRGWENPDRLIWGERIYGSPHGAKVRLPDGFEMYFSGPFACDRFEDQIVIYRFG